MQTFVGTVMSLLFNMCRCFNMCRFVIAFLPRSKCLLISWLQSLSLVILEPKKIKSVTVSIFPPSICHEVMGPDAMIFVFWVLNFKPAFPLSSLTFIKRLFSSSSLSAMRVVSSAYLRLLIFFLAVLIPAWASSSLSFPMLYSAYKLNKQGDNMQPWLTPLMSYVKIWNSIKRKCKPYISEHRWKIILRRNTVKVELLSGPSCGSWVLPSGPEAASWWCLKAHETWPHGQKIRKGSTEGIQHSPCFYIKSWTLGGEAGAGCLEAEDRVNPLAALSTPLHDPTTLCLSGCPSTPDTPPLACTAWYSWRWVCCLWLVCCGRGQPFPGPWESQGGGGGSGVLIKTGGPVSGDSRLVAPGLPSMWRAGWAWWVSDWLCSRTAALRAGPALLEVGTAAAAHRSVLPGSLRPVRGLHPRVWPQTPLEWCSRRPPAGGAGGQPHCELPGPDPLPWTETRFWNPCPLLAASPRPCPVLPSSLKTPTLLSHWSPLEALQLLGSPAPLCPACLACLVPTQAAPASLFSARSGTSPTSSKLGPRSTARRRRTWNGSPACRWRWPWARLTATTTGTLCLPPEAGAASSWGSGGGSVSMVPAGPSPGMVVRALHRPQAGSWQGLH